MVVSDNLWKSDFSKSWKFSPAEDSHFMVLLFIQSQIYKAHFELHLLNTYVQQYAEIQTNSNSKHTGLFLADTQYLALSIT